MNSPTRSSDAARRLAPALALALCAVIAAALVANASAAPPERVGYDYSFGGIVVADLCPFPVTVGGVVAIDEKRFSADDGAISAIDRHSVEQDTFSANGLSLTGSPFTYNVFHPFDADGNNFHIYTDGVLERVPLPDGGVFVAAGRIDFTGGGSDFVLAPDHGAFVNLAGLCAALS
jgi:hypothetical protein